MVVGAPHGAHAAILQNLFKSIPLEESVGRDLGGWCDKLANMDQEGQSRTLKEELSRGRSWLWLAGSEKGRVSALLRF